MGEERRTPSEEARSLYEESESRTAEAMERLVGTDAFGTLLARITENVMALTKIGFTAMDMTVRNMRLAGRQDVVRLARQLARTEDKLELVLQEVEQLADEVRGTSSAGEGAAALFRSSAGSSSGSGGGGNGRRASRSRSANGGSGSSSSRSGGSRKRAGSSSSSSRSRSGSGRGSRSSSS